VRLLKWKDHFLGKPSRFIAEMTDARRDLIHLKAVHPQLYHRRTSQSHTPIIRRSKSLNSISNLYPSQYAKPESVPTKSRRSERSVDQQVDLKLEEELPQAQPGRVTASATAQNNKLMVTEEDRDSALMVYVKEGDAK